MMINAVEFSEAESAKLVVRRKCKEVEGKEIDGEALLFLDEKRN